MHIFSGLNAEGGVEDGGYALLVLQKTRISVDYPNSVSRLRLLVIEGKKSFISSSKSLQKYLFDLTDSSMYDSAQINANNKQTSKQNKNTQRTRLMLRIGRKRTHIFSFPLHHPPCLLCQNYIIH